MNDLEAVKCLSALAQISRLQLYRLLIEAGPSGLTPGVMVEKLAIAPTVLSFHLKELTTAGLIFFQREGRYLIYRASFDHMNALLNFLSSNCCQGEPCLDIEKLSCKK